VATAFFIYLVLWQSTLIESFGYHIPSAIVFAFFHSLLPLYFITIIIEKRDITCHEQSGLLPSLNLPAESAFVRRNGARSFQIPLDSRWVTNIKFKRAHPVSLATGD
jgi:hypothetical protein